MSSDQKPRAGMVSDAPSRICPFSLSMLRSSVTVIMKPCLPEQLPSTCAGGGASRSFT